MRKLPLADRLDVLLYILLIWLYRSIQRLPLAAKINIANTFICWLVFSLAPPPPGTRLIIIPAIWILMNCLMLIIVPNLPRYQRRGRRVHWIK